MPASLRLHHTKVITALALDPKEERLAAGDAPGRILLWHGFAAAADAAAQRGFAAAAAAALGAGAAPAGDGNAVRVPLATMHWHSSAVGCVVLIWWPRRCTSSLRDPSLVYHHHAYFAPPQAWQSAQPPL